MWVRQVVLPRASGRTRRCRSRRRIPDPDERPAPDGTGVRIVVNPSSGPAWTDAPTDALREGLPGADIHELDPDDDLDDLLCHDELVAIGAAGGDGTLAAVATIAAERDVPFVAVPAGTLNHLARDLGLETVDDAIAAVRAGTATRMDLGVAGDRCFVNTLTFGGYSQVVDARERLEKRIGKWPALLVALVRELPRMEPLRVEIDGEVRRVWLAWIGNCRYDPTGFGPSWRERPRRRAARRPHRQRRPPVLPHPLHRRRAHRPAAPAAPSTRSAQVESLSIRSLDGPLRLAADGETYDGPDRARGHQAASGLAGGGAAGPGPQQRPPEHHQQRRPAPPRRPR